MLPVSVSPHPPRSSKLVGKGKARDVWYSSADGQQFLVNYEAHVCYPAIATLRTIGSQMKSQGWNLMTDDPLNPGTPLPPECPIDAHWSQYPLQSYWRDSSGNVVWYYYSYNVPDTSSPAEHYNAVKRSCSLAVSIVYYLPDAYERMIKAVEEVRDRVEKRKKEKRENLERGTDTK